jgi:tetratricopeptide (TPR) repeat protein
LAAKGTSKSASYAAFISYAKADGKHAQDIADCLDQRGFKCWIAPRDVRPGRAYGDEIIRGIESSRCLILVLSSASNQSAFVAREIERAVSKGKPIFPIRIENVEPSPSLELFISSTQWIDAFSGKLDAHIDRLARLLGEEEGIEPAADPKPKPAPGLASPLVLGIGAMAALAAVAFGVFWIWGPAGDQTLNYHACLNLQGEVALKGCDEAIASGAFKGAQAANLYAMRGYQRHLESDLPGALSDYGEAIKLDPQLVMAFNNRGNIYRDTGQYDEALSDYDRALALNPNKPDPLASRGWIYHQRGEIERAREDFARALTLKPDPSLKVKIEEALAATEPKKDSEVISDPSVFWNPETESAAKAIPASPAMPADQVAPAEAP